MLFLCRKRLCPLPIIGHLPAPQNNAPIHARPFPRLPFRSGGVDQLLSLRAGEHIVVELQLKDAQDGGIDLVQRNLAVVDRLLEVGQHRRRVLQAARAENQVGSGVDRQRGGL